jgi:HD-like signal output (HDOD) protein
MNDKVTIDRIEKRVQNLPLIDSAVVKIITLLNNPDSNFEQIVQRLSPDLTARFLNMANTAYYGREVRSTAFAVKLLGYSKMKDILITSILMDHFTKRLIDFNFDRFMNQAQFCTAVARILGEILEFSQLDDLFTVASLQNIGKLVIAVYFKDEHKQIIALKKSQDISTREAEKQILGISHGEIGAIVLKRFSVPHDICDAVQFHDTRHAPYSGHTDSHLPYIAREATRIDPPCPLFRTYRFPFALYRTGSNPHCRPIQFTRGHPSAAVDHIAVGNHCKRQNHLSGMCSRSHSLKGL